MNSKRLRSPDKNNDYKRTAATKIPRSVPGAKSATPAIRNNYFVDVNGANKSKMFLIGPKAEPAIPKRFNKMEKRSKSIDEKMSVMVRRGARRESPATSVRSSFNSKEMTFDNYQRTNIVKNLKKSSLIQGNNPTVMRAGVIPARGKYGKLGHRFSAEKAMREMPSQSTIHRIENDEMKSSSSSSQRSLRAHRKNIRHLTESEATLSGLSHKSGQLKNLLTKKMNLFESLQYELDTKNKEMLDTYNSMKVLHKKVMDTGDVACDLPSLELVRKRLENKLRGMNDMLAPETLRERVDKFVQFPDAEAKAKSVGAEVALIMTQKELTQLKEQHETILHEQSRKNKEYEENLQILSDNLKLKSNLVDVKTRDLEVILLEKEQLKIKLMEFQEQIDKIESEMSKNLESEALIRERVVRETQRRERAERDYEEEKEKRINAEKNLENAAIEISKSYQCRMVLEMKLEKANNDNEDISKLKMELAKKEGELDDMKIKLSEIEEALFEEQKENKEIKLSESTLRLELETTQKTVRSLQEKVEMLQSSCEQLEERSLEYKKYLNALRIHLKNSSRQNSPDMGCIKELAEALKDKLSLLTDNNTELVDELQIKDRVIEDMQVKLQKKEDLIRFLSSKDKEQNDTLSLLQNSLELRHMAEGDINRQLTEKNEEVQTLATSLEMRKRQIRQMKKIILTLEDKLIQSSVQKKKDRDQIKQLKQMLASVEHIPNSPDYALEHLIREIESEIYGDNSLSDETDRNNESSGVESPDNVASKASPTRFMLSNIVQKSTLITTNEKVNKNGRRRLDRVMSSKTNIINRNCSAKLMPYKKVRHNIKVGDACDRDPVTHEG